MRERKGEWYIKFGYKGEIIPKSLIFLDGFLRRIFLLLRANRLYAIFNTGLKNLGPSCPRYVFVFFTRSNGYGSVCHEPLPITNFSFRLFRRRGEGATSVLESQPIIWLLPPPPGVRRPEVTKYQHLLVSPLWATFFLNGHSLTACHCSFQREDSIYLISIVYVAYHVTIVYNLGAKIHLIFSYEKK